MARSDYKRTLVRWAAVLFLMLWVAALVIAVVATLAGCQRPPITTEQRGEIADVEGLWREAGLPDPGDCLRGARVLYTTRSDFRDRCGAGQASNVADECLGQYSRGMFGRRSGWLVLIVDGSTTAERDIRHSLLHALVACTLKRADKFDGNHTDPRVWPLVP